jgi:cytochrome P450
MVFWSPPGLQALGSEAGNKAMASPTARMAQRKTLAPGFSRQALRQVLGKVEAICRFVLGGEG